MTETSTKRLHISGLTPSLSAADLCSRFSTFGSVSQLSGFGALDANGNPKKFAYLTLNATEEKLKRCLSGLSGTVWKGAKLRVGEAKPDYKERILREQHEVTPPRKRARLARASAGTESQDMSLITLSTASKRGAWKIDPVTQTLLRPMRMRPSRPVHQDSAPSKANKGARKRPTRNRASIRRIDPSLWGNAHLKEGDFTFMMGQPAPIARDVRQVEWRSKEKQKGNDSDAKNTAAIPFAQSSRHHQDSHQVSSTLAGIQELSQQQPIQEGDEMEIEMSMAEEKDKALNLLRSMFGDAEEWGEREYIDNNDDDNQEVSTPTAPTPKPKTGKAAKETTIERMNIVQPPPAESQDLSPGEAREPAQKRQVQRTSLKDMFKPQEAEAGFSLFNDLDLDLDLDPTMADLFTGSITTERAGISHSLEKSNLTTAPTPTTIQRQSQSQTISGISGTRREFTVTLDPSLPFFFPYPENPLKNIGDVLDSMVTQKFCRTESSDEIRKRWNEQKGELTREWKKRHREALKARRLRGVVKDL